MSDEMDRALLRIATTAVDDRGRASDELATWFGLTPTPVGERKLAQAPVAVPRLLAATLREALPDDENSYWAPDFNEPGIPEPVQVMIRATARHLNHEPAVGTDLIKAHIAAHGPAGAFELVVAGLQLITNELTQQRAGG